MGDLQGRTFVVTGANTGIGRATAHELARRGGSVVFACRSQSKTEAVMADIERDTGNSSLSFLALDLADLDSVRAAAATYLESNAPIHVLVDNAGVAGQRGQTAQGFELAFGINHLGHFLFTTLLLERIHDSAPARIVVVSSDSHYQAKGIDWAAVRQPTKTVTGLPEYAVSKLANVLFAQELARRLPPLEVAAYSVHPGVIASDIWRRLPFPIQPLMKLFMRSPAEGAKTSVYCATSPDLVGTSGGFYTKSAEKAANQAATPALAAELWRRSEEWTAA